MTTMRTSTKTCVGSRQIQSIKLETHNRRKTEKLTTITHKNSTHSLINSSPMNIAKHQIDICIEDLMRLARHQDEQEKRLRSQNKSAATSRARRPMSEPSKRILELHRFGTQKICFDRMHDEESKIIQEAPLIVVKIVEDEP